MDLREGDGPPLDLDDADSDGARIAQATGLFMEGFGLDAPQALALLRLVSSMKFLSTPSFARVGRGMAALDLVPLGLCMARRRLETLPGTQNRPRERATEGGLANWRRVWSRLSQLGHSRHFERTPHYLRPNPKRDQLTSGVTSDLRP